MNKSSLEITDQESADVQKTTNRVTLESMTDRIVEIEYHNPKCAPEMTIAFVKFDNGFITIGDSAPADPENFNEELGKKFAYESAVRKAWPLFGFSLREDMFRKEGQ